MSELPVSKLPDPNARTAEPAFKALADLAGFGVLLVGEDGTVGYRSETAANVLGRDGAVELGAIWPRLMERERRKTNGAATCDTLELGSAGDRRALRVELHATTGTAACYLVLVETADGDATAQLRLANQALTNSYLASALLHEINAPLNNVKLTLALCDASLARAPADAMPAELRARLERYFKVVGDETSRLTALLEELRRMSTASGEVSETFDLAGLGAEIARLMRHEATIRQIRLDVRPANEMLPARADRRAVLLALMGIVIHLVEQTAAGGVVSVSLARASEQEACFIIESSAAEGAAATRDALDRVSASLRRQDIPLVAARVQIEALHGTVRLTDSNDRFGFAVHLPLAA